MSRSVCRKKWPQGVNGYIGGESLTVLAPEYGFCSPAHVISKVHNAYLGSTYNATFNCPDLGIENMKVAVPAVPMVISPELEQRALARLAHNRNWNRNDLKRYVLGGFIHCGECGHALLGMSDSRNGRAYYRHANGYREAHHCEFSSVRTNAAECAILDYIYGWFLDEPSFKAAAEAAAPSADSQKGVEKELRRAEKELAKTRKEINNLATAVAGGADVSLLLDVQAEVKTRSETLSKEVDKLTAELASMPDAEQTKQAAMVTRLVLLEQHQGKDWRSLPYDEVRRFLHHLFGDNPRKEGNGIFLTRDATGQVTATFRGRVDFHHVVSDGRPLSKAFCAAVDAANARLQRNLDRRLAAIDAEYRKERAEFDTEYRKSLAALEPLYANWWV